MIPESAIAALKRGNKVEAIRLARDELGIDLVAAKEAVEIFSAGQGAAIATQRSRGHGLMPAEAVAALQQGKKIQAIRIVRERHGMGLKDSRDAVEGYLNSHPALLEKYKSVGGLGRMFLWVVGFVLVLVVAIQLFVPA